MPERSHIFLDVIALLGTKGQNQTEQPVRVVGYRVDRVDYYVATDRFDLTAEQIAYIYKLRWDIEKFFGWWKQHLNVYHVIARSAHGLMAQILGGLITYLLLAIYCHEQHTERVSIARVRELRINIRNELAEMFAEEAEISRGDKKTSSKLQGHHYMQVPNRTLLGFGKTSLLCIGFLLKGRYIDAMISTTVLNNGIRVISQRVECMHTTSIGIWVANGSRHEPSELNGIAHFIEHMLFKGTTRRSARQIAMEIDSVGGILNAFTGHEYVCYYSKVLSKFLPRVTDLLSDIFLHPSFPDDEIERERKVILQEIKMRDDSPDIFIHDKFHQNFWQGHSLGLTIPGSAETVLALSREQIIQYKHNCYQPRDIIISAAGNVKHKELIALVEDFFSITSSDRIFRSDTPVLSCGARVNLSERDMEQALICMGTKGLSQKAPDRFALYLLNAILGGGMSSRLFQEVREKRGLAYSIYSYVISYADCGALIVYAGTELERCREVIDIVLQELSALKNNAILQEELDSAREQVKGNFLMSLESSENYMTRLAKNEIYLGRNQSVEEVLASFDDVTIDDIQRLGCKLFDGSCINLEVMGKINGLELAAESLQI